MRSQQLASLLPLLAIAGCGRIGFDLLGGGAGDDLVDGRTGDGTGAVTETQSCATLPPTCGPAGTASCCDSLAVPGGSFFRNYDGVVNTDMTHPAKVSAFRLDKYEVTVARFRVFADAGLGTQQNPPALGSGARMLNGMPAQAGWTASKTSLLPTNRSDLDALLTSQSLCTWTSLPAGNEGRPVNCTSEPVAQAFCIWDGGYLPTDAEWNFAAAGGSEQRVYPWASPPTSTSVDATRASYLNGDCNGDTVAGCSATDFIPVGTRPAGDARWGQSDMGGNADEWVIDGFGSYQIPCDDCADLTTLVGVVKGGRANGSSSLMYSGSRTTLVGYPGIRCARPALP